MPSGLKGYNVRLDGVKINEAPVTDGGALPLSGLAAGTDYSGRITISAVDNAGNETTPVTLANLAVTAQTATPSVTDPLPEATRNAIDALVASKLKPTTKVDGALLAVRTPYGSYERAYGGDRTANSPLTLDDKIRYGSCTKMFVHLLILAQIDAGHLTFEDTVDMYVDDIPNGDKVTIKHLLMMQSGIKDYLQQDPALQQAFFLNPTSAFDPMPYIRSYEPLYEPGTQASYSNSNTILLGMILEWCDSTYGTGRDIRTILVEDSCQALGLQESEWPTTNYMTPPYSRGWAPNLALPQIQAMLGPFAFLAGILGYPTTSEIEWTAVNTTWAGAAGSLAGPITDLATFGEALRDGALISPAMQQLRDETFTTYLTYQPKKPWEGPGWMGFGIGLIQWGHWMGWVGNLGGYITVLFYSQRDGSVIAVALNNFGGETVDLFYQIAYLLDPESTLISDSVLRVATGAEGSSEVGGLRLVEWQPAGDEDGVLTVPHKVPIVL
ncbi:D-alanyl-D-alanine carboxypeptidase [Mycobacterium sp. NS-7484]|uniref:serine hydrolase domain-containing protein n=1 Tax=Mycobacterium sp. NS-7484 TaxID=1834161 RepID=UPI00096CB04D|nr:serine hydrolase domain-containing protein [Mycobacterium sp. NS-7484]OMC04903.1 D-alanyl-D-alanine carboxypeptidase [Mycobacterium sp. NS-7484]